MSKYIDVHELKKSFIYQEDVDLRSLAAILDNIDNIKAAEEDVVRCEHCCKSAEHPNGRWCKIHQTVVQNSDYCSYGVRKDD